MFQSTTKGVLHFEDLSPQQFEDLYRNILHITGDYQDIRAYGKKVVTTVWIFFVPKKRLD